MNRTLCIASLSLALTAHAQRQAPIEPGRAGLIEPGIARPVQPESIRLELMGGSTAPIDLHATARLVALDRILIGASLGLGVYGGLARQIAAWVGEDSAGRVAGSILDGMFSARFFAGVRPFEGLGLELTAGYALLHRALALNGLDVEPTIGAQGLTAQLRASLFAHAL